jgi:hypothetical protein
MDWILEKESQWCNPEAWFNRKHICKQHKEAVGEPDAGEPRHETGPEVPLTGAPLGPHWSIASQYLHCSTTT